MDFAKLWWQAYIFGLSNGGGSGSNSPQFTFISDEINFTDIGAIPLFTVRNTRYEFLIPTDIIIIATEIAALITPLELSIGSDSGGSPPYSNLLSTFTCTAIEATGDAAMPAITSSTWIPMGAVGTALQANIQAISAGAFTGKIILKGIGIDV